ncbi:MAG: cytidylate kinase family protein, partial [Eubacteriales bacterium]
PAEMTEKVLKKQDKVRADYYNFFTQNKWSDSSNYHMCLDTGVLGHNTAAKIIADTVRALDAKKEAEM